MEKRKVYKISIIDKEISRTEFDRNTFYTSDSELTLVFKLIERDYSYDHGEILLYNENDKSFVTRQITKQENDFVYELDSDIIPHYGTWKAQLQLVNDGDIYTSKPFDFSIVNDLSNVAPQPTLTDINNWVTLKQSANELIDEMQDIIVNVEKSESERVNQENLRQQAESERVNQENIRQNSEFKRVNQENLRQQAESQRQSTFETNETERQTTFETAEQERQSAEVIRAENEKKRNLITVDEFVKLQDSVGGRNYLLNSGETNSLIFISNKENIKLIRGVDNGVEWFYQKDLNNNEFIITTYPVNMKYPTDWEGYDGDITMSVDVMSSHPITLRLGFPNKDKKTLIPNEWLRLNLTYKTISGLYADTVDNESVPPQTKIYWKNYKIEKGTQATPYTKAPEDYTVVSKEDYYNHIKLINKVKDNEFNQLKQAVIALGGTI